MDGWDEGLGAAFAAVEGHNLKVVRFFDVSWVEQPMPGMEASRVYGEKERKAEWEEEMPL